MTELRFHLLNGGQTVQQLKQLMGLSESRIRELLKKEPGVQSTDERPAKFFIIPEDQAPAEDLDLDLGETDPNDEEPTDAEINDLIADGSACPLCRSDATQTQAGPEGTYLGACQTCSACGKTYNIYSKEEIATPIKSEKVKRKPLNPQYKIAEKTDIVHKEGGTLFFDRNIRKWVLVLDGQTREMDAREFSLETPGTIIQRFVQK
jgi:hypothetical protein